MATQLADADDQSDLRARRRRAGTSDAGCRGPYRADASRVALGAGLQSARSVAARAQSTQDDPKDDVVVDQDCRINGRKISCADAVVVLDCGDNLYIGEYAVPPWRVIRNDEYAASRCLDDRLSMFAPLDVLADVVGAIDCVSVVRELYAEYVRSVSQPVLLNVPSPSQSKSPSLSPSALASVASMARATHPRNESWGDRSLLSMANWLRSSLQTKRPRVFIVVEIIAWVPVEIIVLAVGSFNALHVVRVTKLLWLWRLRPCVKQIADFFGFHPLVQQMRLAGISTIVYNVLLSVVLVHWVACAYVFIPHLSCGRSLEGVQCTGHDVLEWTWVLKDCLVGGSTGTQYASALYWTSRTMVLLGYDDVTPVSTVETVSAVIVQVTDAVLSTSFLATFLFLACFRNSRRAAFFAHVDMAREYIQLIRCFE